jgi:hypothetical protein
VLDLLISLPFTRFCIYPAHSLNLLDNIYDNNWTSSYVQTTSLPRWLDFKVMDVEARQAQEKLGAVTIFLPDGKSSQKAACFSRVASALAVPHSLKEETGHGGDLDSPGGLGLGKELVCLVVG